MEKYGYKKKQDDAEKTASDHRTCPVCGAPVEGNTPTCPIHGSEPFEERDAEKEKERV